MSVTGKVVLVTGASSGIGAATARTLAGRGWTVYAGARRIDAMEPLRALGIIPLSLDVTEEASVQAAVQTIETEHGSLDALVNNAGIAEAGAIEEVSLERWQRQFAVNVFGVVRLCQLVLPAMRAKKSGRIVNISSMGGEFTSPLIGAYHASKYALESVSDALRFEVSPFGVQVIIVQPGAVETPLVASGEQYIAAPQSPYHALSERFVATWGLIMTDKSIVDTPETIGVAIAEALEAENPPTRLKVGVLAHQMPAARKSLSDAEWDANLRAQYGVTLT